MKNCLTKILVFTALAVLGFSSKMFAADLVVITGGSGSTYPTISDAIVAASEGDRIIVTPISGGAPFTENLAIDKSLQFLSSQEGVMFVVSGNITITPADSRTITFIGMKVTSGSLDGTTSSPAGTRTTVNIMNCDFESGNINLNYDYYNLNLVSSIVKGQVTFRFGRVIGNEITTSAGNAVTVNSDFVQTNDTIMITGNRVSANYGATNSYWGIMFNSSSQYFSICNNYVTIGDCYATACSGYWHGFAVACINVYAAKNSNTAKNYIVNNTVSRNNIVSDANYGNYTTIGINIINIPANASVEAMNNLIIGDNSRPLTYGLTASTLPCSYATSTNAGNVSTSYSYFVNTTNNFSGIIDNGTNNLASNSSIGADGKLVAGSDGIDGGNADSTYYDIDLTRNDIGCYGGSLTFDNFYPLTGTARVYFVTVPRRIIVGSSLNIKAEAFDR